jgi:hypothetical protein
MFTLVTCRIFTFFLTPDTLGASSYIVSHHSNFVQINTANACSLPFAFSYIYILDIDATLKHNKREKQGHLHKVLGVGNDVGRPKGLRPEKTRKFDN